jgi:hypothetical protein
MLLLLLPLPSFAASPAPLPPIIHLPGGGLADSTGRTGFLPAAGGMDAIDLTTGGVLWRSTEAQIPVAIEGDRLYAQAGVKRNRLRLLAFDLSHRGECVLETDPIVLPSWVITGDAPGHSFTSRWRLEGTHMLLAWEARSWDTNKPRSKQGADDRRFTAGVARIDLVSGKVQLLPAEALSEPPLAPRSIRDLDRKAVRWQGVVGGQIKAVVVETVKEGDYQGLERMELRTWDSTTGEAKEPIVLRIGKRLLVQPTMDQQYLCVRQAMSSPDEQHNSVDGNGYHWRIVRIDTGEEVALLPYQAGTQAMTIIGSRVLTLVVGPLRGRMDHDTIQPRSLKSVELKTGKTIWERPIEGKPTAPPPPIKSDD